MYVRIICLLRCFLQDEVDGMDWNPAAAIVTQIGYKKDAKEQVSANMYQAPLPISASAGAATLNALRKPSDRS